MKQQQKQAFDRWQAEKKREEKQLRAALYGESPPSSPRDDLPGAKPATARTPLAAATTAPTSKPKAGLGGLLGGSKQRKKGKLLPAASKRSLNGQPTPAEMARVAARKAAETADDATPSRTLLSLAAGHVPYRIVRPTDHSTAFLQVGRCAELCLHVWRSFHNGYNAPMCRMYSPHRAIDWPQHRFLTSGALC